MIWTQNLAAYLGTFIVWGFLMAFLFNLLMSCLLQTISENKLLIIISGIMFFSYFTSDHFFNLFPEPNYYLTFVGYDLITLICLTLAILFIKDRAPAKYYIIVGLIVNASLFFFMYLDVHIAGNTEPWWLWSFYSIGVNVIDFIMIFSLIINRDFLRVQKLIDYLTVSFLKKALN